MSKAENELSVFRKFVRACSLSIIPESIENRFPPEPDILCKLTDGCTLAFELVEIIDSSLMKRFADKIELESDLKQAYYASPINGFDDADVTIVFTHHSSAQQRKSAIEPIFEALASLPGNHNGRVPLKEKKLSKTVYFVIVSRGSPDGPHFGVSDAGSVSDPTEQTIRRKLEKRYKTTSPLELLAYCHLHHSNFRTGLAPRLSAIEHEIQQSQFRRVWVFNNRTGCIEWMYPPNGFSTP